MKITILIFMAFIHSKCLAQSLKPKSISFSYFGETITHPGFKFGLNYQIKGWNSIKDDGQEIKKNIQLSANIGFFYHKNYQTGLFILPILSYKRQKENGNFRAIGIGTGYLRSIIPNVYELKMDGNYDKINAKNNYFLTNYNISFGKNLSIKHKIPIEYFVKPQLLVASPNTPNGVKYFVLEIGVNFNLKK